MDYKISNLTARQKFEALRAIAPMVSIKEGEEGQWRVDVSSVHFSHHAPTEHQCSGNTTDEAIHETWFWITEEDYKRDSESGRFVGPAEKNAIIRAWGKFELWYRWEDYMWWPIVIQERHGHYVGPEIELKGKPKTSKAQA
jgi:hypothetical protein